MPSKRLTFFKRLLFIFLVLLIVVIFVELALRIICPRYKYAVEAQLKVDRSRIYKNVSNVRAYRNHPDNQERHLVIYNSLGLRQHREFLKSKSKDTIRIGFFGDSFTANLRMPVQYSFTEPLDYLLNKTGHNYEVMNFGTDGYGTDQVYLQYLQEGVPLQLDYVFYVCFSNDLSDIVMNSLIRLDKSGNIETRPHKMDKCITFLNKFYITYFLLDHSPFFRRVLNYYKKERAKTEREKRFPQFKYDSIQGNFREGRVTPEVKEALNIFYALLEQIDATCIQNGTKFYVVTLPFCFEQTLNNFLTEKKIRVVNLFDEFKAVYPQDKEYRFKNDGHWNEEANKLAAVFLFKYLAEDLRVENLNDEFIEQSLYEYYSSFEPDKVSDYAIKKHRDYSGDLKEQLINKYLELEKIKDHSSF